ncbi:sugar ABC transporter permease [Microbacterium sp. MYb62]|nr:sugar ABC transporter permease [Microbacterium sp. MYb62]
MIGEAFARIRTLNGGDENAVSEISVPTDQKLTQPGANNGLFDVFRRKYLLSLIIRKEVGIRYRGSVLGWLWSYVKPLIQFLVFFFALGVFLNLNDSIEYYPLYLLSGITAVTFFNESFSNATRSLVDNAALIKKIYFPRQMFPIASTMVAAINTVPQIIVVIVIALFYGWTPTVLGIGALLLGLVIIALLATGLGLLFGAINVTFRDAQSFVEIIVMVSVWASPVMYQWQMVASKVPDWLFQLYALNPITGAVELFHYGIWHALDPANAEPLPSLWLHALIALAVSIVFVIIGEIIFRRLEGRFAQDL